MTARNPSFFDAYTSAGKTDVLEFSLLSDVGLQRDANEDCATALATPEGGVFIVADGMGGHNAGDVASQLAIESIETIYPNLRIPTPERLLLTLQKAGERIHEEAKQPGRKGMGTTVAALAIDGGHGIWASAGDSRIYLLRKENLIQLTRDHSWVAEQQRRGLLSEEEAQNHRWRSIISNALGSSSDTKVDLSSIELIANDLFLICSDGLSGVIDTPRMAQLLNAPHTLTQKAQHLVEAANAAGGPDNITVLLVWIHTVKHRTLPYALPTLKGDGPVSIKTLLGPTELEESPPNFSMHVLVPVSLWVVLVGLVVFPDYQMWILILGTVLAVATLTVRHFYPSK